MTYVHFIIIIFGWIIFCNISDHSNDIIIELSLQEKVYNEQKEILFKKTKPELTYTDLNDMKYLEMVIKESLRLYTPIPFIGRELEEDTYFGEYLFRYFYYLWSHK